MAETKDFYTGTIEPGEAEGVECPYCGAAFVVFMLDPEHPESGRGKFIPCTGTVDYFCPCCGKNLKDYIKSQQPKFAS